MLSGGFNRIVGRGIATGKGDANDLRSGYSKFWFCKCQFTQAVRLDYDVEYSRSRSNIEGGDQLEPIDVVQQEATMNFIIKKKFICRVGCDYYYNAGVGGADRNMFSWMQVWNIISGVWLIVLRLAICWTRGYSTRRLTVILRVMFIPISSVRLR